MSLLFILPQPGSLPSTGSTAWIQFDYDNATNFQLKPLFRVLPLIFAWVFKSQTLDHFALLRDTSSISSHQVIRPRPLTIFVSATSIPDLQYTDRFFTAARTLNTEGWLPSTGWPERSYCILLLSVKGVQQVLTNLNNLICHPFFAQGPTLLGSSLQHFQHSFWG